MISLAKWAAERFTPTPHPNTLRAWARDGKVVPAPVKIGRAYYVRPDARHIDEVLHGATTEIA